MTFLAAACPLAQGRKCPCAPIAQKNSRDRTAHETFFSLISSLIRSNLLFTSPLTLAMTGKGRGPSGRTNSRDLSRISETNLHDAGTDFPPLTQSQQHYLKKYLLGVQIKAELKLLQQDPYQTLPNLGGPFDLKDEHP